MGKEWKQIERKNDGRRDRTDDQVSAGPRAHRCVNHYATASGCHLGDNLPICQQVQEAQDEQEEAVVAHPLKVVRHPLEEAHLQMGQMVM